MILQRFNLEQTYKAIILKTFLSILTIYPFQLLDGLKNAHCQITEIFKSINFRKKLDL